MPVDGDTFASRIAGGTAPKIVAGRYEIRDRIGRGAFGEVFEVYDQRLGRLVALKTLPIDAAGSAEAAEDLQRFHQEARAVARLSHPGIVTVHDFGETKDFAWIAMKLVIGETLKAVLDRGERPSLAETVRVTSALLDALHYAHGRGIVHRDVKPANILLSMSAADNLGEVQLTDFGIARIGESQQTVAGQVIGTPTAMSPEQVRGEDVDLRSDLWSVGVILYQLLTGKRPFPGGMSTIFHHILTQHPEAPSLVDPEIPSTLDEVVAKALAKDAKDRYPSAAAMAAALRDAAAPWRTLGLVEEEETVRLAPPAVAPLAPVAPVPRASRAWAVAIGFAAGTLCGAVVMHQAMTHGHLLTARTSTPVEDRMPDPPPAPPVAADPLPVVLPVTEPPAEQAAPAMIGTALEEAEEPILPASMAEEAPTEAAAPETAAPEAVAPEPAAPEAGPEAPPLAPAALVAPVVEAPSPAAPTSAEPLPPAMPPPSLVEPSSAEPPPAVPGVLSACEPGRLAARTGSHPGFGRVVFDWTTPTRHEFRRDGDGALLRFPGAGCLPQVDRLALPRNVLGIRPDEAGSGLRIATAPGSRLRLWRLEGNRVVLDVLNAVD